MKTNTYSFLLFFFLLFFQNNIYSQCTIGTINNGNFDSGECSANLPIGQSFTACSDGLVSSVSVVHGESLLGNTGDAGTYELYMAIDPGDMMAVTATDLVATNVLAVAPNDGDVMTFNLAVPFPVVNDGTLYRFVVTNTTGVSVLSFNNPGDYANGAAYTHLSANTDIASPPGQDVDFEMTIQPSTLVPTLSEWGLIILALIILNIGFVYATSSQIRLSTGRTINHSINWKALPFQKALYFKILSIVAFAVLLIGILSINFFGYEVTNADPFGLLIGTPLLAYLIMQIIIEPKK